MTRSILIAVLLFLTSALHAREFPSDTSLLTARQGSYLSSALAINPCADVATLGTNDSVQGTVEAARANLPPGACSSPDFVIAHIRLFYVQRALLGAGQYPFSMIARIETDTHERAQCRDLAHVIKAMRAQFAVYTAEWNNLPDPNGYPAP